MAAFYIIGLVILVYGLYKVKQERSIKSFFFALVGLFLLFAPQAPTILYVVGFIVALYGMYKVKYGYGAFKGWLLVFLGIAIMGVASTVINNVATEEKNKTQTVAQQENKKEVENTVKNEVKKEIKKEIKEEVSKEEIDWNKDFSNPESTVKNTELCVKAMKKMNRPADKAKQVKASNILNNPAKYLGQMVQIGVTVHEVENAPQNSGIVKSYGQNCHMVVASADDGTVIMEIRKGNQPKVKANDFTVAVGMPAGIVDIGNNQKAVMIIGIP